MCICTCLFRLHILLFLFGISNSPWVPCHQSHHLRYQSPLTTSQKPSVTWFLFQAPVISQQLSGGNEFSKPPSRENKNIKVSFEKSCQTSSLTSLEDIFYLEPPWEVERKLESGRMFLFRQMKPMLPSRRDLQKHDSGNSNRGSITTSGVGWGGRWEGGSRGRGHRYTCGWLMLMFGRNQLNTIKQLSFN